MRMAAGVFNLRLFQRRYSKGSAAKTRLLRPRAALALFGARFALTRFLRAPQRFTSLCRCALAKSSRNPALHFFARFLRAPQRHFAKKRSEEHTSELQSHLNLVCRLLLEKKTKACTSALRWPTCLRRRRNSRARP